MTRPLDLEAIEARVKATLNGFSSDPGTYIESAKDVPALLQAVREARELLRAHDIGVSEWLKRRRAWLSRMEGR